MNQRDRRRKNIDLQVLLNEEFQTWHTSEMSSLLPRYGNILSARSGYSWLFLAMLDLVEALRDEDSKPYRKWIILCALAYDTA